MHSPKASVIIAVYNRLDFLQLVLAGLEMQTETDFEVVIADDGSNETFIAQLNKLVFTSKLHISHHWHQDKGFRKSEILNIAVHNARGSQLIFIDHDCIPHPKLVEEYLANARPKHCLAGRRIDMSPRLTRQLTPELVRRGFLQRLTTIIGSLADYLTKRSFHFMNGFYVTNPLLRRYFNHKKRGLLGANFSISKADLVAVNGFDERYTDYGYEDSDLDLRFRLNSIEIISVINICVTYHCWHKQQVPSSRNFELYKQVKEAGLAYTQYGMMK
jgi:glycosyltransferase involved in cell wall biosynthesis